MQSKKSCQVVSILIALFLWFFGSFHIIDFREQALDLGYPKDFVAQISILSKDERYSLLKKTPSLNLAFLVQLFLKDNQMTTVELEIVDLVQKKYGQELITKKQAEFFFFLSTLPGYKIFFSYDLSLKDIDSLPLNKDILNVVSIEVYQKNDNRIPIFMYHSVDNSGLAITKKTFINQLSLLYNAGFSCMKLDDYIRGDFSSIPNGRKPIILTFDDGWKCHFSYLDKEGSLIDPDCVVGILEDFAKKNPLFGKTGVFFLYMNILPFTVAPGKYEQLNLWKKKVQYLEKNGFEIGCHTFHHKDLRKADDKDIVEEFTLFYNQLKTANLKSLEKTMFLAYPWGTVPKNEQIVKNYSFENNNFKIAVLASKGFAIVPFIQNKNIYEINRISGYDSLVKPSLKEKTFTKFSYKLKLPKLYLSTNQLLVDWIQKNTAYETKYLLQDPSLLFSICEQ